MSRSTVLLLTLGLAMAVSDNVLVFKSEELPFRPDTEADQHPQEGYPENNLNDAVSQKPTDDSKYKLSHADYQVTWESFKIEHNKQYATKDEETNRNNIFLENLKLIESHNLKYHNGETSFYLGINHFADLTTDEYNQLVGLNRNLTRPSKSYCPDYSPSRKSVRKSVDWRKAGYVSSVKDQGDCGACYAFSSIGAIEGQWFKKTGQLLNLSVQQVIDCSDEFFNDGCIGGYFDSSFKYAIETGGLETEKSYAYEKKKDSCAFDESKVVAKISSCSKVVPERIELALEIAVDKNGPVSAVIDPSGEAFKFYKGGIYYNYWCNQFNPFHAVLVVGYSTENYQDFWIVKNSFSEKWGEEGYIRMARNKGNNCGIATQPMFPNL